MLVAIKKAWGGFAARHPGTAQFLVFFVLSNGMTVLQMVLLPLFKWMFGMTSLIDFDFQVGRIGHNIDGSPYYIFNYAAGALVHNGGGGLAYFLAVQITLGIAQITNFFAQRKITFKSNSNIAKAAFWYFIAYIVITVGAAALQGLYKAPIYNLFINDLDLSGLGETLADFITMIINSAISFWVFFPLFKVIFRNRSEGVGR